MSRTIILDQSMTDKAIETNEINDEFLANLIEMGIDSNIARQVVFFSA